MNKSIKINAGKQLVADLMTRISSKDQSNQGRSGQYRCGVVCKAAWKTFTRGMWRGKGRGFESFEKGEITRKWEINKRGNCQIHSATLHLIHQLVYVCVCDVKDTTTIAECFQPTENPNKAGTLTAPNKYEYFLFSLFSFFFLKKEEKDQKMER